MGDDTVLLPLNVSVPLSVSATPVLLSTTVTPLPTVSVAPAATVKLPAKMYCRLVVFWPMALRFTWPLPSVPAMMLILPNDTLVLAPPRSATLAAGSHTGTPTAQPLG